MIGDRIKQARLMAAISQDELVHMLAKSGVQLTKAGLSKYERGSSVPKATLLQHLAAVLRVQPEFFLKEQTVSIRWLRFRKRSGMGMRDQERIHAMATAQVEAYVRLRAAFTKEEPQRFPQPMRVRTADEAEAAAGSLRRSWHLQDWPIESMTELIESREGIVVELTDPHDRFDGLSGVANDVHAVIIADASAPDDRKRFTFAHELGHLLMDTRGAEDEERLAHRFAAAFLMPASLARKELGEKRLRISLSELTILKQKHGLGMQSWVLRARDLHIIDEGHYGTLIRQVRGRNEMVEYKGNERPIRLRQMVLRAYAEGVIGHDQALRWCPDLDQDEVNNVPDAVDGRVTARALMRLPREKRNAILREAAAHAGTLYDKGELRVEDIADDWEDVYGGR